MNEGDNLIKGSVHEDDLFIVHNDLLLITAKKTIDWIRKKWYLHRWLFPLNGLQYGTHCAGRPVGNSPEFMPLDNSLNRDILRYFYFHSVLIHCILDGEGTYEEEIIMRFSY